MLYKIIQDKELDLDTGQINILSTKVYAIDKDVEVFGNLSELTSQEIQQAFDIAVKVNVERLRMETQEALKTGLEYPENSGNHICLDNNQALQIKAWYDLTKQQIAAGLISFPIFYVGAGFENLNFQNESEVDTFFNTAFTVFNKLNTTNFKSAYDALKSVEMVDDDIITAINQLEAISYVFL